MTAANDSGIPVRFAGEFNCDFYQILLTAGNISLDLFEEYLMEKIK